MINDKNGISVRVNSVENLQEFGDYHTIENFVVIYFSVVNRSNQKIDINPLNCNLKSEGKEFEEVVFDLNMLNIQANSNLDNLYIVYRTQEKSTEKEFILTLGYNSHDLSKQNTFSIILN